ncbi:MAG: nitroreductase family protein [Actinomycetota bacterium]|nr:nitroreductase family protein [Actinomycetota bacterium]
MVRRYASTPVDPAAVRRILDVAVRGPSAGFAQGVRFVVVTDAATRAAIAQLCDEPRYLAEGFDAWLSVAPVHVVIGVREADYRNRYGEPDKLRSPGPDGWQVPFWWVDAGAALMLLLLGAVDEGLAAGFIDVARPDALRRLLDLPSDVAIVGLATLGRPLPDRPSGSLARGRRPAEQVIRYGRWSDSGH